jgi:16S rRNA (cytidine1402-2'-O)-methyltransferase
MENGKLYLIPCTLGDDCIYEDVLPKKISVVINQIDEYIVENEKSARQFLKKAGIKKSLSEIILHPLNEHTHIKDSSLYLQNCINGKTMGLLSDAGCPGIADPGAEIIKQAHQKNINVIPLVGPSSILLAMMASGFNGQSFAFNGYLSKERNERIQKLKELEKLLIQKNQTQLFIETPYRNQHLLDDIIETCLPQTKLCIACDITLGTEFIKTQTIAQWKKNKPDLNKRPCIFVLGN